MATQPAPAAAGTAVARRPVDPDSPAGFRQQLRKNADKITLPQHISMEAFENVVFSATIQNPDLLKADRESLFLACLKAAQDGLLPNGRDAALVTFNTSVKQGGDWVQKKLVQYMPMVAGLRSKILRAVNQKDGEPLVRAIQVGVVYKVEADNGYFHYELGTDPPVRHRPILEITAEEATDENIVAAYSVAFFADGTQSAEVMRRFEIDKVRQCSQTGAVGKTVKFGKDKGKPIPPKGPWVDWFPEMAKKTVLRRHSKVLPMAGDVVTFEAADEASDFRSAENTAALLASADADEPQRLEDQRGEDDVPQEERERIAEEEGADRETGEIVTDPGQAGKAVADATGKEHKPRARPRAAEPQKAAESAEGNASGGEAANSSASDSAGETERSASEQRATPATAAPAEDEQTGITKSPADAKADELLHLFNRSETVIDLEKHKREFDKHKGALEADHISILEAAYERNCDRLYGSRG
jgi:recombination protein RecT